MRISDWSSDVCSSDLPDMIKPHGSDTLQPRFVYDTAKHAALSKEAESLPSLLLNSSAAANAVMLGAGYFNPLSGYMNLADALSVAKDLKTTSGLFWPEIGRAHV